MRRQPPPQYFFLKPPLILGPLFLQELVHPAAIYSTNLGFCVKGLNIKVWGARVKNRPGAQPLRAPFTLTAGCTEHPFNGPLSRTTRVSRYQKGKTNLDLLEQETASGSGISCTGCTAKT